MTRIKKAGILSIIATVGLLFVVLFITRDMKSLKMANIIYLAYVIVVLLIVGDFCLAYFRAEHRKEQDV